MMRSPASNVNVPGLGSVAYHFISFSAVSELNSCPATSEYLGSLMNHVATATPTLRWLESAALRSARESFSWLVAGPAAPGGTLYGTNSDLPTQPATDRATTLIDFLIPFTLTFLLERRHASARVRRQWRDAPIHAPDRLPRAVRRLFPDRAPHGRRRSPGRDARLRAHLAAATRAPSRAVPPRVRVPR